MLLEYTGERVIPDQMKPTNGLYLEHIARYYFSNPYAHGRVLDFACGSGYGTQFIAKTRRREVSEIIGVDISEEAIHYAKGRYNHPLASYQIANVLDPDLPQKLGTFDTLLSFETIEHVPDEQQFIKQVWHLLKPGGTLVLSTPFGQGKHKPSSEPFHYFQLTPDEFEALFKDFDDVEIYHQRGVTIEPPRKGVRYFLGVAVCRKPCS
ncbi:methyltransferase domain-containing protein [Tuberibacillus sp. Marseille-P3662]|uniref:methyltransferase domain-containing protein n=1 Tax=Tuberibacillus sp. Marseille-P3662 TaxID=1965358 RepID=UPI000A1CE16B|nr:methyltransferase domain-containing protein [Tuberibacillus sp. Marseille-P3662]